MKRIRAAATFVAIAALGVSSMGAASATTQEDPPASEEYYEEEIVEEQQLLHDQWADALAEDNAEEVQRLEGEMQAVGIELLDEDEVELHFPGLVSALRPPPPVVPGMPQPLAVTPQAYVPPSGAVKWSSTRTKYTYKGREYQIQTITATPTGRASSIRTTGSVTVRRNFDMKAGVTNAMKVVVGAVAGANAYTATLYSLYDVASGFVSGLNKQTVISDVTANYTWAMTTTVQFKFVKPWGSSDSAQNLGFVSTRISAATAYSIPNFVLKNGTAYPRILQRSQTVSNKPSCYGNSSYHAVRSYLNISGARYCNAAPVVITGVANATVRTIRGLEPTIPLGVK